MPAWPTEPRAARQLHRLALPRNTITSEAVVPARAAVLWSGQRIDLTAIIRVFIAVQHVTFAPLRRNADG